MAYDEHYPLPEDYDESAVRCPDYYVIPGVEVRPDPTLDVHRPLEVWDIVRAMNLNHQMGNILKYVLRAGRKPGQPVEKELRKIIRCAEGELQRLALLRATNRAAMESIQCQNPSTRSSSRP